MNLDLLALLIFALFVAMGCWRGALASGLAVAGLAVAYGSALLTATLLGPLAAERLETPVWLAAPLIGTAAGLLAYILFAAYSSAMRRNDRERLGEDGRGAGDRLLGGVFGACRGGLVVVLLAYLALWLDVSRDLSRTEGSPDTPQTTEEAFTDGSIAAQITGTLVESAVEAAAGDDAGARVMARFASQPKLAMMSVQTLSENEALRAVQADDFFWTLVKNGAADRAANRLSFQAMIHDDSVRREFRSLGLVSEHAGRDAAGFRAELTPILEKIGPRLKALEEDPEIHALAEDPEVLSMLESGNTLGLMGHPKIREIATRMGEGL